MKIKQIELNNGVFASIIAAIMFYGGIEIVTMVYVPDRMLLGIAISFS